MRPTLQNLKCRVFHNDSPDFKQPHFLKFLMWNGEWYISIHENCPRFDSHLISSMWLPLVARAISSQKSSSSHTRSSRSDFTRFFSNTACYFVNNCLSASNRLTIHRYEYMEEYIPSWWISELREFPCRSIQYMLN